jgi:tRNA U34 2-thiouridine synthase MnmA/TrmU
MTFLEFPEAKKLMRKIAKDFELKNEEEWINFTKSKNFEKFLKLIPKKPWNYYSKANVMQRKAKEAKK